MANSNLHLFPARSSSRPYLQTRPPTENFSRPHPPRSSSLQARDPTIIASNQVEDHTESRAGMARSTPMIDEDQTTMTHDVSPVSELFPTERCLSPPSSISSRRTSRRLSGVPDSLKRRNANRRSFVYNESLRTGSPIPLQSDISVNQRMTSEADSVHIPMNSMFPQYQSDVPLSKQQYYPQHAPQIQYLPSQQISKGLGSPPSFAISSEPPRSIRDTATDLIDDFELLEIWNATNGEKAAIMRNIRMKVSHTSTPAADGERPGLSIGIGSAEGTSLYMMTTPVRASQLDLDGKATEVKVQRSHPSDGGTFPVAEMSCQPLLVHVQENTATQEAQSITTVFPQIAALSAIREVANSIQARSIAQFDPNAASPQAAQLALDAVGMAKEREEAVLVFVPASFCYDLQHPVLGTFNITSSTGINLFTQNRPRGKITMSAPLPTDTTSSSRPPVLASLDLESDTLELDMAAISRLQSPHIIDTIISTLLVVAISESSRPINSSFGQTYFPAPPKTPTVDSKRSFKTLTILSRSSSSSSTRTKGTPRSTRKEEARAKKQGKREAKESRLPPLTRGVLRLLGFSFDAIVWLLSLGVKTLSKLVICVSGTVEAT